MNSVAKLRQARNPSLVSDEWTETLLLFVKAVQGRQPIATALDALAAYFDASAVCLSRRERGRIPLRVVQIVDHISDPRKPKLLHSFYTEVVGDTLLVLKSGTAVSMSETKHGRPENSSEFSSWLLRRNISDIGIICLGSEDGAHDFLEFHFSGPVSQRWQQAKDSIGKVLAEVFHGRKPGLLEHILMSQPNGLKPLGYETESNAILAPENVHGLTRSEWRLCILIGNGFSRDGAAKELNVTSNTIRTHLRNIYDKTGHASFHELALRLVTADEQRYLSKPFKGCAA